MKWFKFYGQDYISDPKMLSLSASERSCWVTLLSFGSINDNGVITFLDESQLMAQSGISPTHEEWERSIGVLEKLEKLGMITLDNDMITIRNWQKRQETSLTGYERVKKFREKKRNDNAMITSDKIRIEKNRINTKECEPNFPFTAFWGLYGKKIDKPKCEAKWKKLSEDEQAAVMKYIPLYLQTKTVTAGFQKHPATFLNNRSWENEIKNEEIDTTGWSDMKRYEHFGVTGLKQGFSDYN